ncbi:MAG: hypothetical protein GEU88_03265 [Solirubrobacterales bacterium]|nr:hypothetical protein [Solirubrobacterales bacterium]
MPEMGTRERLLVEIDRTTEPISGVVRSLDGPGERVRPHEPARRFNGYIELITALEQAGRGGRKGGRAR